MKTNDYQDFTKTVDKYPQSLALPLHALGLCGEAGEVAEKIKKMYRDCDGELTEERRQAIKLELGDTLWYLARVSADIGFTLEEVAQGNVDKLTKRNKENKMHGDGDYR